MMGVNVSTDPVLEVSAPVLLGKLLADARDGKMKHKLIAPLKISLRVAVQPVLADASTFLLDATSYNNTFEGGGDVAASPSRGQADAGALA